MRISFNLLKEFVNLPAGPKEVASILTSIGFEVENYLDYGEKYKNFVVAEVITCEKITEKLSYCKVFDGTRNYNVVCGAPNVQKGIKVVLALPGAVLPKNNLEIKPTTIRGYQSEGMICSEDELEIGDCDSEILVLEENAKVGEPFASFSGLADVVYEIGITPNRGDCLSHLGIARELSAYFDLPLTLPKIELNEDPESEIGDFVSIEVLDQEKCPRYTARVIRNVTVAESPAWLKSRLILLGLRPINAIVDVTNYVMMELGQPLHAFDYDKLALKKIVVRTANPGEKFVTLDGKERILDESMLMICDGEKPVAIGGVMGGENSEISSDTRNVLLESAFFNPVSIRRTSKKLGLMSESSYRFERGVDYENTVFALHRASQLIAMLGGGKVVSGFVDIKSNSLAKKFVPFRFDRAKRVIGIDISNDKIRKYLSSLGFKPVEEFEQKIICEVPSFRFDVEQEIDLIEEVARYYGYDNIPEDRSYTVTYSGDKNETPLDVPELRKEIKNYFISNGFTEILTQNLYSPKKAALFHSGEFIEISNPLGEEYSIVKTSIIPSILEIVKFNLNVGKKDLRLFEIGKEFRRTTEGTKFIEGVEEKEVLVVALSGLNQPLQWGINNRKVDFYDLKGIVEHFLQSFECEGYIIAAGNFNSEIFGSEYAMINYSGKMIGEFGVISTRIAKAYEIDEEVFVWYIYLEPIYSMERKVKVYKRISPFPVVRRDLAFIVDEKLPAEKLYKIILENVGQYLREITIFDVFKGKNIGEGKKNLAFALFFNSYERTLTVEEVQEWIDRIVQKVKEEVGGELRVF